MAGNQKAVRQRIKSVQSTMQICKAMELVAASRLHRAKERADRSRPYFRALCEALSGISQENSDKLSVYTKAPESSVNCYIVVAGDRGFAGGYNNSVFALAEEMMEGKQVCVLPVGKKAMEHFAGLGVRILTDEYAQAGSIGASDCFEMADVICSAYRKGEIGRTAIVYTKFVNMMTQKPVHIPLLPVGDLSMLEESAALKNNPAGGPVFKAASSGATVSGAADRAKAAVSEAADPARAAVSGARKRQMIYEPDSEAVFDAIVPDFAAGLIYSAVSDSVVSELAARRMMMDSATNNAQEMIDKLNLQYNRMRQAGITQELTEITAGSAS